MMGMEEENMQLLPLPLHHRRRQQLLPRLLFLLMYATIWLLNVCMPKLLLLKSDLFSFCAICPSSKERRFVK
jgi:hypothetical protein